MFGAYRLILAFMVVFLHLGGWPGFGEYAVFTFFCLSGYLMTYIMHENYGFSGDGRKKYLINRLLRIYPLYLSAALFSLLVIFIFGESYTSGLIFNLKIPDGVSNILGNLFLVITDHKSTALVPPAWALTVEILYYALIGLGLSKSAKVTWLWFICSVVYTVTILMLDVEWWDWGYFHPLAASLPFSVGALLYHYRKRLGEIIRPLATPINALALYGLVLINWAVNYKLGTSYSYGFYINSLINIVLLLVLTNVKVSDPFWKKWDKRLGDLSYPIYLMHWAIAIIVMYLFGLFGIELEKRTELFAIVSIPFMLFFGQLMVSLLHNPIEILRNKIKG
ncbi:MAG: acyltransferase family protein [Thalassotalea sp.]